MWPTKIHIKSIVYVLFLTGISAPSAFASFLDSDFWCRTYGCAVVHDGQNYDIYDNWVFQGSYCCVPFGSKMIDFYIRAGDTNLTGTTNRAYTYRADNDESLMLGITQGGGTVDISAIDDGDGYLDADDTFGAFTLNTATDVMLDGPGRQYSHSFFISSRNTRFSLRALASVANASGDFAQTVDLADIKLTHSISDRGNDSGFDYGARARTNNLEIMTDVDDLGDLQGTARELIRFEHPQGIRVRNGDIDEQTIRLDFLYTMPEYDLSMGVGSLDVDVVFDFYRER